MAAAECGQSGLRFQSLRDGCLQLLRGAHPVPLTVEELTLLLQPHGLSARPEDIAAMLEELAGEGQAVEGAG